MASTSDNQPSQSAPLSQSRDAGVITFLKDYKEYQQLPTFLHDLYCLNDVKTEFHAFCVLLHNLMIESGFELKDQETGFTLATLCSFDYKHSGGPDLQFTMSCNTIGPYVVVNGLVHPCTETQEKLSTTQFKLNDFVKFPLSGKPSDSSCVYKNLAKLSREFKKDVAYLALENMRFELKLPPLHGILSLFPELLQHIFSFLDMKSLVNTSIVCKQFNCLSNNNILWKNLFMRDFGNLHARSGLTWKENYVYCYKEKKSNRRFVTEQQPIITDPFSQFPPFSPFVPGQMPGAYPFMPGAIGGDYDLYPSFPPSLIPGRTPSGFPRPPRPDFDPSNPFPGSRFDPFGPGPGSGNFRPGRGGGMFD